MRLLIGILLASSAFVEEPEPRQESRPAAVHYLGRRIAKTMSFHGANWLKRPEREKEERASQLFEALAIREGWTVADLGCGNGFHTLPMAEMVGPKGKILAVDIQPEMLRLLERSAKKAGVGDRIESVLATATDPKLPPGSVDLLVMVDVYHEISHPEAVLAKVRRALKPKGRAVWVEFRTEDVDVPIKAEHKMSKAQVVKEATANGFKLVRSFDALPWQHALFFERDDEWKPATKPERRVVEKNVPEAASRGAMSLSVDVAKGALTLRHRDGREVSVRIESITQGETHGVNPARVVAAPWTVEYASPVVGNLRLSAELTSQGMDVIASCDGMVAAEGRTRTRRSARQPIDLRVALTGPSISRRAMHRIGAGGRRGEELPWRTAPAPTTNEPTLPLPVGLSWPLFGLGGPRDGVAMFMERLPRRHAFSLGHVADQVTVIGRRDRPEPEVPFAFRFHVALPESCGRPDLIESYEAWSQERIK